MMPSLLRVAVRFVETFYLRERGYVIIRVSLLVCLLTTTTTTQPIFTQFGEKMTHGPWKNPLRFGW